MIEVLSVRNYRSLLDIKLPLGGLNVITGANGSGKSNLYRALRLLSHTATGDVVSALAADLHLQRVGDAGLAVELEQPGMLRRLGAQELSDGTLRFLLWVAALLTPRPPPMMVLNEPETSLHPDLLPALANLIAHASTTCQIWVVTHSNRLINALEAQTECASLRLEKDLGETRLSGQGLLDEPAWQWTS